jgi:hypothetical protein
VIQEAQFEARKRAAQATSSGVPSRPSGCIAVSCSRRSAGILACSRSVRMVRQLARK